MRSSSITDFKNMESYFLLFYPLCHNHSNLSTPLYRLFQAGVFLISFNFTSNGLFSHVLYALKPLNSSFGFHSGAPSANSRSKFHNSAPRINLSSTYVKFLPMQPRGPSENGCAAFLMSLQKRAFDSGVSRKRSGMKESGLAKLEDEWAAAQEATHTEVWAIY